MSVVVTSGKNLSPRGSSIFSIEDPPFFLFLALCAAEDEEFKEEHIEFSVPFAESAFPFGRLPWGRPSYGCHSSPAELTFPPQLYVQFNFPKSFSPVNAPSPMCVS